MAPEEGIGRCGWAAGRLTGVCRLADADVPVCRMFSLLSKLVAPTMKQGKFCVIGAPAVARPCAAGPHGDKFDGCVR
jgi:hypothetical protein